MAKKIIEKNYCDRAKVDFQEIKDENGRVIERLVTQMDGLTVEDKHWGITEEWNHRRLANDLSGFYRNRDYKKN